MQCRVLGHAIVDGGAWTPTIPIHSVNRLRVVKKNLMRAGSKERCGFAVRADGFANGSAVLGLFDPAVQFIAQPVTHQQSRSRLPIVLEIKVVSLAADRSLVKPVA